MIEIDRIELAEPFDGKAAFNFPNTGRVDGIVLRVAGWFRQPRSALAKLVRFTLVASESSLSSAALNLQEINLRERIDVPCRPLEICLGFDGYVDAVSLPRTFRIQVRYQRETGEDCLFGEIRGRRTVLKGNYTAKVQPLIVFHAGRMGSTAMMRTLLAHPRILVNDRHPYEAAPAEYFSRACSIMLSTPKAGHHVSWDSLGPNPYLTPNFQSHESIEDNLDSLAGPVGDFARARIDCWYRTVAVRANKPASTFFAEKAVWPQASNALLWLYPTVKLILMTRDPRDVFRSARDFNAKRGIPGFGRELVASDEEWINLRGRWFGDIVDVFDNHPEEDRLQVRFEDLIQDTRLTLSRVCAFLGLENSEAILTAMSQAIQEETPQTNRHRTSLPGQEVGRWRDSVTDQHARQIARTTRIYMRRFGYDGNLDGVPETDEQVGD